MSVRCSRATRIDKQISALRSYTDTYRAVVPSSRPIAYSAEITTASRARTGRHAAPARYARKRGSPCGLALLLSKEKCAQEDLNPRARVRSPVLYPG